MPVPLIAAGIGAVGSAAAANKAAKAQSAAAGSQIALQRQMFDEQKEMLAPYREAGGAGLNALAFELGLAEQPEGYGGFTATPGYEFRRNEGLDAVQAGVGARHGLNSGATMQAMERYGQDYAANEYGTHLNRLTDMSRTGQSSAAMTGNAAQNFANQGSAAYANMGNAQAAGAIGIGNALQGGINNGLGLWAYGKANNLWGG